MTDWVTEVCPNKSCGVAHAIPRHIYDQARRYGKDRPVYCPNGHTWWYTETDLERAQAKAARLQVERDDFERAYLRQSKTARYWKGIAHRRRK